jgi:hypothetical protein
MSRVRQLGRQRRAQTRQPGADDDQVYPLIVVDLFTHFKQFYTLAERLVYFRCRHGGVRHNSQE